MSLFEPRHMSLGLSIRLRNRVPFLNTSPLTDIRLILWLTPIFWVLGIEQFAAPSLLLWSLLKLMLRKRAIRKHSVLLAFATLISLMCVSALSISETLRYVTFIRNLGMVAMGAASGVIILTEVRSTRDVRSLLLAVVGMMTVASTLGALSIVGIFRPTFESLIGPALPSVIASTSYADRLINRSVGNISWFQGLGSYFRVNSIFLFSTTYAAALAITMPVVLYFARAVHGFQRILFLAASVLIFVNLIYSTGRMAWIGVAAASVGVWVLQGSRLGVYVRGLTILGVAGAAFFMLPLDAVEESFDTAINARGSGSAISRSMIYQQTLSQIPQRPFFGWGTERDITTVDGFPYPAGSHSTYLGYLYKHGVAGLAALLLLLGVLWRGISTPLNNHSSIESTDLRVALQHLRWAALTAGLIGVTTALDLDTTLMLIVWVVVLSAVSLRAVHVDPIALGSSDKYSERR